MPNGISEETGDLLKTLMMKCINGFPRIRRQHIYVIIVVVVVVDHDSNARDVTVAFKHVKMNKQPEMKQCFFSIPPLYFSQKQD